MLGMTNIIIDLDKSCEIVPSVYGRKGVVLAGSNMARNSIFGWGYAVPFNDAIRRAAEVGMNLDAYLTAQVAAYLHALGNRKSQILIWYANASGESGDVILLYISSRRECKYMRLENSYDGHTEDVILPNGEPFMYYDGRRIRRVYFYHAGIKSGDNLIYDMGQIFPLKLGNADKERYDEIVESPLDSDNIVYSSVIHGEEQVVEWDGRKIVVERAFCNLRYCNVLSDEGAY